MLFYIFAFLAFVSQINSFDLNCERNPSCRLNHQTMTVICDSMFSRDHQSDLVPSLSCFPPVNEYLFRNFQKIQSNAFQNLIFHQNQSFRIQLSNISIIESETFSRSIQLPDNSDLTIEIEHINSSSNIIFRVDAFNHIKIDRLRFFNLNQFNGHSLFDTDCFSNSLQINELIFEECGLTGFSSILQKSTNVNSLMIINSPELIELSEVNLPSFLSTTKSLQISNTGLQSIQAYTFREWSSVDLEELIISNNSNFENFSSDIIEGAFTNLNKLDLSYNPIKILDANYNWSAYNTTTELILRNQQLDLFLQTNILKQLPQLEIIDFFEGFITGNNDDLFKTYFNNLSNLISIDISYVNVTENMIIDLLTHISQSTDHFIDIHLLGHTLTDQNFCSYFIIFKNAPNLLNLQLDETHECNCVIDLFFTDTFQKEETSDSMLQPSCLFNATRTRCDIEEKLSKLHCQKHPDPPNTDGNIGKYAFGAIVAGLSILLLILISLGFTVVYQIRRGHRTHLFMEQPVDDPSTAIIDDRS